MRRAWWRACQGVVTAVGAPVGWLLIEALRGRPPAAAVAADPALYVYMLAGTMVVFGAFGVILGEHEDRLVQANRTLQDLAVTDSLTGLRNVRYFHTRLAEEHAVHERTGEPLSLVIIDLDHFKRVNDRHGHPVGDDVLEIAARAIASVTRQGETEARIGGEEFGLLLPGSDASDAFDAAERVRQAIAAVETPVPDSGGAVVRITASAGVASTTVLPGASVEDLYRAADQALYDAKRDGRNRTVIAAQAAMV